MPELVDPSIGAAVAHLVRKHTDTDIALSPIQRFVRSNALYIVVFAIIVFLIYYNYKHKSESIETKLEKLVQKEMDEKYNSRIII
jgi:hypothetical protein